MLITRRSDLQSTFSNLSARSEAPGPDYLKAGRQALVRMLADPMLLDGVRLERVTGAYTRNVIFSDERITVCAMVWAAGARTSIHDHHCSCCYAILSGSLEESWYEAVDETHVVESRRFMRRAGEIACMLPTGPNLHRMVNSSDDEAISIHIYGYDCRTRASSIGCEYTAREKAFI